LFEPGFRLAVGDLVYTVVAGEKLEDVEVRSDNGQTYHINLLNRLGAREMVSVLGDKPKGTAPNRMGILSLSEQRYQRARAKYLSILPLLSITDRSIEDVEKVADRASVSTRTIYSWLDKYTRLGFKGLVTPEEFGGKGRPRTEREAESVLQHLIETEYNKDKHNKSAFYQDFVSECWKCGIRKVPSKKTVYRRLIRTDKRLATESVLGKKAAELYRTSRKEGFADGAFPLQTVQLDHSKLDVILVDEATSEVIGRPWLTVGLDIYSRCVWGYYLGLQQPNADTVGLTIINGCFEKQRLVEGYHLNEWPVYGIPFQIHTDNGKDFRSKALERGCIANQINIMRRPVETPEYGPFIERFFRTLETEFVHTLPGTTFSNIAEKGEYDSDAHASLSVKDFEKLFLEYVVNQYHNTLHSGIETTPLLKWKEGVEGKGGECPIVLQEPEDVERFRQDFLPFVEPDGMRKIEKDGVHFKGLVYYADELRQLQYSYGLEERYYVRYDPSDLRFIYVYDGAKDLYYRLLLNSRPPAPFTIRQLESSRRLLRSGVTSDPDEDTVMETIFRRRQYVSSLAESSKKARRSLASDRREEETRSRLIEGATPPEVEASEDDAGDNLATKIMLSLDEEEPT
jgi:putative transposase